MSHFKVERHSDTEWRVINAHLGHGLIFPNHEQALLTCQVLNTEMERWLAADGQTNPLPERLPLSHPIGIDQHANHNPADQTREEH